MTSLVIGARRISRTTAKLLPRSASDWISPLPTSGSSGAAPRLSSALTDEFGEGVNQLARQMGGDAPLMAGIVALTTVGSALSIPILLALFHLA